MTSTEVLAGDFIKKLLKNLPKEEVNEIPQNNNIKSEFNTKSNKNFNSNSTILKLRELKNYFRGNSKKELISNETINDCLLFPALFNINLLMEKIFKIFEVKSINEIYLNLIEEFKSIYINEKKSQKFNTPNDFLNKKYQLFDIIQELNFFISPSIIYVSDPIINKISFDIFISNILNENKIGKNILESFINIFNIKHLVLDYIIWNKDKIIKSSIHIPKLLSLISILNLQKNFSFEYIIFHKKNIFFEQDNFVYDLYCTYNSSIKQLIDLTEYLILIKRNWVSILVIEKIIYDKSISERINNHIKKLMIVNLMDVNFKSLAQSDTSEFSIPTLNKEKKASQKLISYYHLLSDNRKNINFDFNAEIKGLNNFLSELIKNKDWEKIIKLLNFLDNKFICNIKKEYFHQFIKEISFDKIERIINALKHFPDDISYLLSEYEKKNNIKDGIKLIKLLNLDWKEYDKKWDRYSIRLFYNYKIKECLEDKFDILLDYALVSETLYNELINKLLNKINNTKNDSFKKGKENMNINLNMNFKEYEFEEPGNNILFNPGKKQQHLLSLSNKNIKEENEFSNFEMFNNFDNIFKDLSNEYIIQKEDSEDDNDCRIILNNIQNLSTDKLKEKITILFKTGREKNYLLTKTNKYLFDNTFNYNLPKINMNKYNVEDRFAPHDKTCFQLDPKKVHICFVDTISKLSEQYIKYFQHTKIIGIDAEWKQQFYARSREFSSIIQMANYEEKNIIIIDMMKLIKEKEFIDTFNKFFSNKTFVGYSFDTSDIEHFSSGIQNTFKKANIIDLIDLYQYKYLDKAKGLKSMCNEILGINICKYEQCSFWENRPLKQSQLHYAAVDAFVCVSLYKKLINNY